MEGKKKYIAIILFLLIGLGVFTFANPDEELGTNNGSNNGGQQQVETDDNDDNTQDVLEEVEEDNDNNTGSNNNVNNVVTRNDAYAKALAAVQKLEQVLTEKQAETARDLVEEVTNSKQYADLIARVENAEDAMDATKLVEELEKMVEEAAARTDIENAATNRDDVVTPAIEKIEGENLEGVKEELTKRVEALAKLLDDSTAPTVEPDVDGTTTNKDVALVITDAEGNEFTATVTKDGQTYELKETFTEDGIYEVKVVDAAFNEDTITFTIDKTEPEFENVKSGQHFGKEGIEEIKVKDATDVKVTIKNMDTKEEKVTLPLTKDATYYIVATDAAGNSKAIYVAIDTDAPDITGVTNGSFVNKAQNVYVTDKFLNYVKITGPNSKGEIKTYEFDRSDFEVLGPNGENFKLTWKANYQGIYTVYAKDKVGNEYSETFTIDKTPVKVNGLENAPFTYDGVGIVLTSEDNDIKTITLTKDGSVVEGYKLSDSIINAGEYTLTIVDRAGNVTEETFVINKAQTTITMTPEEGTKFRYDATAKLATAVVNKVGSTENLTVTYKDDKGYKHTEPVKPGKYTATAVYAGDENHEGSEASVKYQIIKAASSIAFTSEPESLVYDGTAKEFGATVTLVNGTKAATITYYDAEGNELAGAPVNAGSYKVVASFKGDTLHDGVKKTLEKEFTIEKADITIAMTPEEGTKFRYDATAKLATATLNTLEGPVALEVTYKDDKGYKHEEPIKPGKYTATAVFEGNQNYNPVTEEVKYQIIKAASSIAFTSEPESLVYDGTAKEFGATVTLVNGTKSATMTYYDAQGNKLDGAPVNAGSYKVVASFKGDTLHDGVKKPLEKEFTIERAETEIVFEFPNLVYDGTAKEVIAKVVVKGTDTLVKEVTPVYKKTSYENLNETPVNAGTYIVAAYYGDTNNYVKSYNAVEYTIEKAETEIVFTLPENLIYSETAKEVIAKVMVKGTDTLVKEVTPVYKDSSWQNLQSAPVNAGKYIVAAYYYETENYKTSYNSLEFTIEKATPTIELTEPSLVYNAEKQEYGIKVFDVKGNEVIEPNMVVYYKDSENETLPEAPTNAGTYRLGIYVRPNENYTRADKWITFTVEKATPTIEITEPSLVYNGQKQEYGIKVFDVKGNEVIEPNMVVYYKNSENETLPEAPTNAGTYRLGIYVRPNENYTRADKWITFTVEQKQLDFEFAMDKVIRYDGTPKTAVINVLNAESENDYQVKISFYEMNSKGQYVGPLSGVTSVTDSGIYRVKVTLEAVNPNYKSSNTKKFDFYIEDKANILNLNRNLLLVDEPYYNNVTNTTPVEINGNGYTVHHIATGSVDLRQWGYTPGSTVANHALMGSVFSSSNGSSLTVKNLTLTGETQSVSLGHYVKGNAAAQSNYNTTLTNVNIVGLKVVSYSAPGITPGVVVYGKAVLNNTNIYGTKFSKQDTLKYPIYDLVLTNYTDTTINGGKIGTIFTWNHAGLKINGAEVDTILTATTKTKATSGIFVNSGSKVNLIDVNESDPYAYKAKIVIESGATVNTLDLRGTTDAAVIDIKDGAIVNKIITDHGEMTLEEWKAL